MGNNKFGLGSFGPIPIATGRNLNQQDRIENQLQASIPDQNTYVQRHGIITDVNSANMVKVKFLDDQLSPTGIDIAFGSWLSLKNPLADINHRFGSLRKGLYCIVHYKGIVGPHPTTTSVEIFADESYAFHEKEPESNQLATSAVKLFGGGMG